MIPLSEWAAIAIIAQAREMAITDATYRAACQVYPSEYARGHGSPWHRLCHASIAAQNNMQRLSCEVFGDGRCA